MSNLEDTKIGGEFYTTYVEKETEDQKGGVISQRSDSYLVAGLRPEPDSSDNLPIALSNLRPEDRA